MAADDNNKPTPSEPPIQGELPMAESPPLSIDPPAPAAAKIESQAMPARPRPVFGRRQKQLALLTVSIVLAAGIGGVIGALANANWTSPRPDVSALEERKALQQSIAHLTKQVAALKTDLDKSNKLALDKFNKIALDMTGKPAASPIAKTADRVDSGKSTEITGTVPAPAIAAPAAAPATVTVPLPRPAPRPAAAATHPAVLTDWRIYEARGGYIYVEGHGDIYQVVPGAPLPGLGPVQSIRREDGAWVVVTPKGIIVAARDRRRFE
jgi:hypothetical protein